MPRINAASLAEHRAKQRRALLDAARDLLADGSAAPSLAEVGRRAGLARTSLYQYFSSREELLDAVIADVLPGWRERIHVAMSAAATPGAKVAAYIEANLALVDEGEHAVVRGLATHARDRMATAGGELHEEIGRPLLEALGGAEALAELVQSVVYTASRMLEEGRDRATVTGHVATLLGPFFKSLDD
ncbi:TetR/AcrR family transcriptional regulator [Nocardioides jishulii]|uniref:TetR/AcrR family transcriptional regulator n=1 Tax=Nocardioides jishulii TaxID=2575440 RepID=A0A4U2YU19_9ACTN|nr:TetR/AcrR family transcriptional regulator [Nocardioides jishulii]QCX28533.1 TetR/AcrR family transcriptional regulator [Nocardioides jishulii]TKI64574.1 TetR/AcrR family transcriptional regulator [Nocardioides jishulii]